MLSLLTSRTSASAGGTSAFASSFASASVFGHTKLIITSLLIDVLFEIQLLVVAHHDFSGPPPLYIQPHLLNKPLKIPDAAKLCTTGVQVKFKVTG